MEVTQELLDFLKNNLEIQVKLNPDTYNYGEVSNEITVRVSILFGGVLITQDTDTLNG